METGVSESLRNARTHRRALAGAMHHWVGRSLPWADTPTERHSIESAYLAEGEGMGAELLLSTDSRATPWVLDLEAEAFRLSSCEKAAVLLWDVASKAWRPRSMGCQSRLCPVCGRVRAARACTRWRAVLEAAVAEGATLRHWTFTQPASVAPGGLVTGPEWRRGWRGTLAAEGVVSRAVGGEGLGAAYTRLRKALAAARDNRSSRDVVKPALGGHLVGCEWTGRGPGGVPRWHAHAHVLACTPPGEVVDERAVIAAWVRLTGGSARANHVRTVDPDAVVEVLKYPFKPAHLSSAQRIETLAFMRGMHPHHVSGSWSALSTARRTDERWNRWLSARPPDPEFRRLHYLENPWFDDTDGRWHGVPMLWTGQPSEGMHVFTRREPSAPDGWLTWVADAAQYAVLLGDDPELGGVVPDLEPGSDEDEDWFRDG